MVLFCSVFPSFRKPKVNVDLSCEITPIDGLVWAECCVYILFRPLLFIHKNERILSQNIYAHHIVLDIAPTLASVRQFIVGMVTWCGTFVM